MMVAQSPVVPKERLREGDFSGAVATSPDSLVYFLLNVGDGDTQLVLLPQGPDGVRRALVVDVATNEKLPKLLESLSERGLLGTPNAKPLIPLVVATHPHDDHIGGMPQFLEWFGELIGEFWEPGYYHTSDRYQEMMIRLEDQDIEHLQPTSGTTRFIGKVKATALSPGIGLRSRFESYGVEVNDASIVLRIAFPAARVSQDGENRHYLRRRDPWSLILGADAQTTSWARTILDFPQLHPERDSALYKELQAAIGADPLKGHVFKVPHHASKHGLNIELVERIGPTLSLVSSTGGSGRYGFPHLLAVEAIREARQPIASKSGQRRADYELGIHYTCALDDGDAPKPLGSMAVVVPPKLGSRLKLWRFGDEPKEPVDLDSAREFVGS